MAPVPGLTGTTTGKYDFIMPECRGKIHTQDTQIHIKKE